MYCRKACLQRTFENGCLQQRLSCSQLVVRALEHHLPPLSARRHTTLTHNCIATVTPSPCQLAPSPRLGLRELWVVNSLDAHVHDTLASIAHHLPPKQVGSAVDQALEFPSLLHHLLNRQAEVRGGGSGGGRGRGRGPGRRLSCSGAEERGEVDSVLAMCACVCVTHTHTDAHTHTHTQEESVSE